MSAAFCGPVVLAGWLGAGLAGFGWPGGIGMRIKIEGASSAIARAVDGDADRATAIDEVSVPDTANAKAAVLDAPPVPSRMPPERVEVSSAPDLVRNPDGRATGMVDSPDRETTAALSESHSALESSGRPVLLAAVSPTEQVKDAGRPLLSSESEALDACLNSDACVDQYLWSVYAQTPKVDTMKVEERFKSKVKIRGKVRTVVKTLIKYIAENFAWKDPEAAQKAGMSLQDYVIGGMDRAFKRNLYGALHAMNEAGFSPGITSGFRDNYRQEIATGNKAASDSSYHGGSRRGGYGHGLAADLVSVKGDTRAERYASSEILWKWIDTHEKELRIGRPYLDKDPPHVAPIDGQEYADKRKVKTRLSGLRGPSLSSKIK
jgi:hypothetical protein